MMYLLGEPVLVALSVTFNTHISFRTEFSVLTKLSKKIFGRKGFQGLTPVHIIVFTTLFCERKKIIKNRNVSLGKIKYIADT